MWQLDEPDDTNDYSQRSTLALCGGLVLSALLHLAWLAVQLPAGQKPLQRSSINVALLKPTEEQAQTPASDARLAETLATDTPNVQAPTTPRSRAEPMHDTAPRAHAAKSKDSAAQAQAQALNIDVQQAVEDYMQSQPEVEGRDLDGRVFDPELAAKIYAARRDSKARPGFGPGSYEKGVENGRADPRNFNYSGGLSQRWVKVNGKCFLVHEDAGVGALKGAFSEWMRTSCKRFNPKYFDDG